MFRHVKYRYPYFACMGYCMVSFGLNKYDSECDVVATDITRREVNCVIIGDSPAASAAVQELQKRMPSTSLLVLRGASCLIDQQRVESISEDRLNVLNTDVVSMDLSGKQLTLSDGTVIKYVKCLIASDISRPSVGKSYFDESTVPYDASVCGADVASRAKLLPVVQAGGHVTILGADNVRSIELTSLLASEAKRRGFKGVVTLAFPSYGILSSTLPRYLSTAISRRLRLLGVETLPYSQIQYVTTPTLIALDEDHSTEKVIGPEQPGRLLIYFSRTFDSLQTCSLESDRLAVSTEVLPGNFGTIHSSAGSVGTVDRHFGERAGLETDFRGGFVVNRNMLASDDVYVAGDLASIPIQSLGRGVFSGRDHAILSGKVAARNMVGLHSVYDTLPVSELRCTESGIYLGMIGNCCAALETHGFWWKIASRSHDQKANNSVKLSLSKALGKLGVTRAKTPEVDDDLSPPLGLGVVFYVSAGVIVGVLLSGLVAPKLDSREDAAGKIAAQNSYLNLVYARARSLVGVPIEVLMVADSIKPQASASIAKSVSAQPAHADLRGVHMIALDALLSAAKEVIVPAINPGSNPLTIPRPSYRYGPAASVLQSELSNRAIAGSKGPTRMPEKIFHVAGNSGSRADRIAAAYASGIRFGIGPSPTASS